jgi:DNA (cytosine-5)-methyltransferase 1
MGAIAAGYAHLWGNEIVPEIAEVAKANGLRDVIVANVLDLIPRKLERPDLFHASTVCTNASIAKANGEESALDLAVGEKVAEFIRIMKPNAFTLENVSGYRDFDAFRCIMRALDECGYFYDVSILNAADFGVPQTRRRLFVRAKLNGFVPYLPTPIKWVGWYSSIADIVQTFEETKFADWQIPRLPIEISDFLMAGGGNTNFKEAYAGNGVPDAVAPAHTVTTLEGGGSAPKAFLMTQQNGEGPGCAFAERPSWTVTANRNMSQMRAFIVSGATAKHFKDAASAPADITVRDQDEPVFTLTAQMPRTPARAWLACGRVVKISPRGGARFQSIPNTYELPKSASLAWKIIGNSVPPLEYQRIAEAFL